MSETKSPSDQREGLQPVVMGKKLRVMLGNALKHADRREWLGKEMNRQKLCCPECGDRQIQLLAYIQTEIADWRCRCCGHRFEWDPNST